MSLEAPKLGGDMAGPSWVVVVEAERGAAGTVEVWRLRRLLESLRSFEPIGLHSSERVAVQVRVDALGEAEALGEALRELRGALDTAGLHDLRVMRSEVMSEEEFERGGKAGDGPAGDGRAGDGRAARQ